MKDVFFTCIFWVYERGGNVISFRVRPGSLRGRAGERNKVREEREYKLGSGIAFEYGRYDMSPWEPIAIIVCAQCREMNVPKFSSV